eukprot:jgi/Picre1/28364/NNA_003770.t1
MEDAEDGPVLTYSDTLYGDSSGSSGNAVETGLMDALNRDNVQLTSGAIRRLKSMGLEENVREIISRKKKVNHLRRRTDPPLYQNIDSSKRQYQDEDQGQGKRRAKQEKFQQGRGHLAALTRFSPKFVDEAGWSPYWNASFVNESEGEASEDVQDVNDDASMKNSDTLFKKVLHGRSSAARQSDGKAE